MGDSDLDVFRDWLFDKLASDEARLPDAVRALLEWAPSTADDKLLGWIAQLPAQQRGWCSHVAGQIAVVRAVAGDKPARR